MKIRELAQHWQRNASEQLSPTRYQLRLGLESSARLEALAEMYPSRSIEELMGELLGAALEELVASLPYIKGSKVIAIRGHWANAAPAGADPQAYASLAQGPR